MEESSNSSSSAQSAPRLCAKDGMSVFMRVPNETFEGWRRELTLLVSTFR